MKKGFAVILTVLVFGWALTGPATADIFIKQRRTIGSYEIMGQEVPGQETTVTTWMGGDRARTDDGDRTSMIFRLDSQLLYLIDHRRRTFLEIPMTSIGEIVGRALSESQEDMSAEEKSEAAEFMKDMTSAMMKEIEAVVTDTGEEKTIGSWKAHRYILQIRMPIGSHTSEVWSSEEVAVDMELYRKISGAMNMNEPGLEGVLAEMTKIKGFPVYSTDSSQAMGMVIKTTQELLEVKSKDPPQGLYEAPQDYIRSNGR